MEFEQIIKQLEFLDAEHRKDKTALESLQGRITSLEGSLDAVSKQIKQLSTDVSQFSATVGRLNQFDEMLAKQRADFNKAIEDIEKKYERREREVSKTHQTDLEGIRRQLTTAQSSIEELDIVKRIQARIAEETRLNQAINELKTKIEDVVQNNDEVLRAQKMAEETRRQDVKRLADLQGELAALRKRLDEHRDKMQINSDAMRNTESRITELLAAESERKAAQASFIEQQSRAQVDRDHVYKEWLDKLDEFKKQSQGLDSQIIDLDESIRAANRAQETYVDLNQKLERRINEITEMQRLAEERLRQEWITFKADDQKRWTGFNLSQEETLRDIRKDMDKLDGHATTVDDSMQTLQDQLHQTTDSTEQQLQELMNWAHEWLTAYERIMGHARKTSR